MNKEQLRELAIQVRCEDILRDSDRLGEIIAEYSDVIAVKMVKCKLNRQKVGNDLVDYLGLCAWDLAEDEIDYEQKRDAI